MHDQKITATDEMVARARESLRSDGWTVGDGDTGLRAAITAALDVAPTTEDERISDAALAHAKRLSDQWRDAAHTERARAEKAEKERDEVICAGESLLEMLSEAQGMIARGEVHTMTARELLDAAIEADPEIHVRLGDEIRALFPDTAMATTVIVDAVRNACDPPTPKRPEWADLGEALDRLWPHGTDGIAREDIARRLHTEEGVRVVSEDDGGDETPDVCPHVSGPGGDCGCPL